MYTLLILIFAINFLAIFCQKNESNVCKTFKDYYLNIRSNPNCYYNPDVYLSVPEIIKRHGYPVENYTVTTDDGYILTMFRIPYGRDSPSKEIKQPVFIQHGVGTSSIIFVYAGRRSLAFTLADAGYDVWLGNFRGCRYSDKHVYLSNSDRQYWDFTFHENGVYDLPAQLNLVTHVTGQKVFYLGYSMGSTAYFVYNSVFPHLAQPRIKYSIIMAPIGFMGHIDTPVRFLIPLWPPLKELVDAVTNGVLTQRTPEFIADIARRCLPYPTQMEACLAPGYILFGYDKVQEQPELLPVFVLQGSDAVGTKTLSHFVQLVETEKFQHYDFGPRNEEVYGTPATPQYNLSKINVPNYFIRANKDPLSTKRNAEETFLAIPEEYRPDDVYVIKFDQFNHGDFVAAKDAKELVYDHIVDFLDSHK